MIVIFKPQHDTRIKWSCGLIGEVPWIRGGLPLGHLGGLERLPVLLRRRRIGSHPKGEGHGHGERGSLDVENEVMTGGERVLFGEYGRTCWRETASAFSWNGDVLMCFEGSVKPSWEEISSALPGCLRHQWQRNAGLQQEPLSFGLRRSTESKHLWGCWSWIVHPRVWQLDVKVGCSVLMICIYIYTYTHTHTHIYI